MDPNVVNSSRINILGTREAQRADYHGPRASRHAIERRRYLPLNRIHKAMFGGAVVNPWPLRRFDLVHAWNRVPLGATPFVVGFDKHMPLSWEHTPKSFNMLMDELASPRCRRIVAASQAAATITMHRHENDPRLAALLAKTVVRLPNVVVPSMRDWFDASEKLDQLRIVFVGDQFGARGGCVAVKLAEKARSGGVPIHVTIVSSLACGGEIWPDPEREAFFEPYLKLLDQPNITVIKDQSREKVVELIAGAHVKLLAPLGDWYDFSTMEGMARFTPAMVMALGAFPEFIDSSSGVLLKTDATCQGEWRHVDHATDRKTPAYEKIFADTTDELAEQALAACVELLANPARLGGLRQGARRMAEKKLDSVDASRFWDQVYLEAVGVR